MSLFDTSSLNEGVRKREVFGWAMYDFANSGYTTVVLTAVFNAYFVGVVAANASWATLGLDQRAGAVQRRGHADACRRSARWPTCAPAKKRLLALQHRRLRARHRAAGAGRAGRPVAGDRGDRAVEHLLHATASR